MYLNNTASDIIAIITISLMSVLFIDYRHNILATFITVISIAVILVLITLPAIAIIFKDSL